MANEKNMVVRPEDDGKRLDQVLEMLLPDSGLRERRRIIENGRVLVGGKTRTNGYKVRKGQVVVLVESSTAHARCEGTAKLTIVGQSEDFAALHKPSGMHTESIRGSAETSLEECLLDLLPGSSPRLLNRLDYLTSGIVMVALTEKGSALYKACEDNGEINKSYVALVSGRIDRVETLRKVLDTANRKKTRVLSEDGVEPLRWTRIEPVSYFPGLDATLIKAFIRKGARHQIRAHLADLGHPIIGDPVYGSRFEPNCTLYLHHYAIEFPGFSARILPDWPEVLQDLALES